MMSGPCWVAVFQCGACLLEDVNAWESANDGMPSSVASLAPATVPE